MVPGNGFAAVAHVLVQYTRTVDQLYCSRTFALPVGNRLHVRLQVLTCVSRDPILLSSILDGGWGPVRACLGWFFFVPPLVLSVP